MSKRIDHAAESERIARHLGEDIIAEEGITDATIIATQLDALRHATLALVEQQRIANMLAAAHLPGDVFSHEKMREIAEGLGL